MRSVDWIWNYPTMKFSEHARAAYQGALELNPSWDALQSMIAYADVAAGGAPCAAEDCGSRASLCGFAWLHTAEACRF
jgi:hypothetical protein